MPQQLVVFPNIRRIHNPSLETLTAEGGHKDPLKVDCSDPLKLGCDEFTTIVGEEMGGGKKVAHRRDRLHCGIYAHAAWYSGAARHPYPNSLPG